MQLADFSLQLSVMPQVVEGIRDGESVATTLRQLSHCPRVVWQMVEVAEAGYRIDTLMALMEPLLISLLAGLVGFTVVALMVPLYGTPANLG